MSISTTPEFKQLVEAIDRTIPADTASDLLAAFYKAVRAEILREVYRAIEDPAQRAAVGGGLGWETARDVVHSLMRDGAR